MTAASITRGARWDEAIEGTLREAGAVEQADLALLFASADYAEHYPEMLARVQEVTGAATVAGCSGGGVIGPEREIEDEPAVSLVVLPLPGAQLHAFHISQDEVAEADEPEAWFRLTGLRPEAVNAWLVLA